MVPSPIRPRPPVEQVAAYRVMTRIRAFEEAVHVEFATGAVPGAVHLYAGQEAVAAGVCGALAPGDHVASTHRGHGHAIAQGCDLTAMAAELLGRDAGLCRGKGGSMHIADVEHGMLGANGVAAAGAPLACGGALSAKLRGTGGVAVTFVGDGAVNQGAFAESLVLAAVWSLPVVFVVEDNGFAQSTGSRFHLPGAGVVARAGALGIPAERVAGDDVLAVHAAAVRAVDRARTGGGPSLLECPATRFHGHMEGWDQQGYRTAEEMARTRAEHDPLLVLRARATASGCDTGAFDDEDATARDEVAAAFAAARLAPEPDLAELTTGVYAS